MAILRPSRLRHRVRHRLPSQEWQAPPGDRHGTSRDLVREPSPLRCHLGLAALPVLRQLAEALPGLRHRPVLHPRGGFCRWPSTVRRTRGAYQVTSYYAAERHRFGHPITCRYLVDRRPSRDRRIGALGPRPLPAGLLRPGRVRRHGPVRGHSDPQRWPQPPPTGTHHLQLWPTRGAELPQWPRPVLGWSSSTSTACGDSTPAWPRCSRLTTTSRQPVQLAPNQSAAGEHPKPGSFLQSSTRLLPRAPGIIDDSRRGVPARARASPRRCSGRAGIRAYNKKQANGTIG